jgi:hypothetical protein
MSQFFESADGSRRNLRIALFAIILLTLPFYCIGFVLWSVAPQSPGAALATRTPTLTLTPSTLEPSDTPGVTLTLPPFVTPTGVSPLLPTPIQFNTPGLLTPILPPTSLPPTVFIPPPTIAPTLTFVPPPPTNTPVPPTITPIPPTNTSAPPPTVELPTSTTLPFPTETETPTPTDEMFSAEIEIAPENSGS